MPKTKSIKDEAAKYLDLLEEMEDKEKDRKWIAFKRNVIMSGDKYYEKLSEAMRKIECSEDFVYEQTWRCLNWLVDESPEDINEIWDVVPEVVDREVDIYTSKLTGWLNEHNSHVYYLTEALAQSDVKDGFQLLSLAQYDAIREIWVAVITIVEHSEGE